MRRLLSRFSILPFLLVAGLCLFPLSGCLREAGGGSTTSVPIEGVRVIREIIGVVVTAQDAADFSGLHKNTPYSHLLVKVSAKGPNGIEVRTPKYYLVADDRLIRDKESVPSPADEVTVKNDTFVTTVSAIDQSPYTFNLATHVLSPEPESRPIIVQVTTSYESIPVNSPLRFLNYAVCQIENAVTSRATAKVIFAIKMLDPTDSATHSLGINFSQGPISYRNQLIVRATYTTLPDRLRATYTESETSLSLSGTTFVVDYFTDGSDECFATRTKDGRTDGIGHGIVRGALPEI